MDFEILLMFFFSSLEIGKDRIGKGKGKERERKRKRKKEKGRFRILVGLLGDGGEG